jgi:hypothetical protein
MAQPGWQELGCLVFSRRTKVFNKCSSPFPRPEPLSVFEFAQSVLYRLCMTDVCMHGT